MAYQFQIGDIECRCDTPEELRAIAGINGRTRMTRAKAPRARVSARATPTATSEEAIRALPFVDSKLNWKSVKKIGKGLGRKDFRTLRSELKQRQELGK